MYFHLWYGATYKNIFQLRPKSTSDLPHHIHIKQKRADITILSLLITLHNNIFLIIWQVCLSVSSINNHILIVLYFKNIFPHKIIRLIKHHLLQFFPLVTITIYYDKKKRTQGALFFSANSISLNLKAYYGCDRLL